MSSKHPRPQNPQQPALATPATIVAQRTETRTETRIAPIPDPGELGRYKELDPELYELIKREFAKNGEHRRELEQRESRDKSGLVKAVSRNDTLGTILSWVFASGCATAAFFFIWNDKPVGAVVGVLGVLPSVIAAIRGKRDRPG